MYFKKDFIDRYINFASSINPFSIFKQKKLTDKEEEEDLFDAVVA